MPVVWLLRYANRTSNLKTALTRKYRIAISNGLLNLYGYCALYRQSLICTYQDFIDRGLMQQGSLTRNGEHSPKFTQQVSLEY